MEIQLVTGWVPKEKCKMQNAKNGIVHALIKCFSNKCKENCMEASITWSMYEGFKIFDIDLMKIFIPGYVKIFLQCIVFPEVLRYISAGINLLAGKFSGKHRRWGSKK